MPISSQGQRAAPTAGRAEHSMGWGKGLVFPVTPDLQPPGIIRRGRKPTCRHYLHLQSCLGRRMVSRQDPLEEQVDSKN